ncbi:MAG: hypothetical protein J6M95_01220 [Bacilli bacterium]|nr:hypothetical protein [Bacilli bacterium]
MKKTTLTILFASVLSLTACGNSYVAPTFKDDDYSYLLSTFYGVDGELNITKDYASTVDSDGKEVKLYPTEIKTEEFSYLDEEEKTIQENLVVVYYGKARNDANYRIRLTSSLLKFVAVEKEIDGKYVTQSLYSHIDSSFAGAYNGLNEISDSNYVYIFGNEIKDVEKAGLLGFDISIYYASGNALQDTDSKLIPGYYLFSSGEETLLIPVAQALDLNDGEFYGDLLYANSDTSLYGISGDMMYETFFADPTMFFSTIVDENGKTYNNSYEIVHDDTTNEDTVNYMFDGVAGEVTATRSSTGLSFSFKNDATNVSFTINPDLYTFKLNGSAHRFASMNTFFKVPSVDWDENILTFVSGDFQNQIEMYYSDFDWETYEDIDPVYTYKYNGQEIENYSFIALNNGSAALTFKNGENDIRVSKEFSNTAIVSVGETETRYFESHYYQNVFAKDYVNPGEGYSLSVDSEFKVSENGGEAVQGNLVFSEILNTTVLAFGNKELAVYDQESGIYAVFQGVNGVVVCEKTKYSKIYNEYTSNGTDTITINENGELFIEGNKVEYSLGLLPSGLASLLILIYQYNGSQFIIVPTYSGSISVYKNTAQGLVAYKNYFAKNIFNSLIGEYCYEGKFGKEYIKFSSEGILTLDTINATGDGLDRDVEANAYFLSVTDSGIVTITASVTTPSGVGTLSIRKSDYSLVFANPDGSCVVYTDSRLLDLKGVYGDGTSNTLAIFNNVIVINETAQTIQSIEVTNDGEEKVTTIVTLTHTIVARTGTDGSVTLSSYQTSEGVESAITYTDKNNQLANFENVKFALNENKFYGAMYYYSSVSGKVTVSGTEDGKYFGGSTISAVYNEGKLVLKLKSFFGSYALTYDESGNPVAISLGGGVPPVPPLP